MVRLARIACVVLMVGCLGVLCACGHAAPSPAKTDSSATTSLELTDRQRAILEQEGLPADPGRLSVSQTSAIISIEACLSYLDEQHPEDTFAYVGYWSGADGTDARLEATCSLGTVTVYETYSAKEGFSYRDTYAVLEAMPAYREAYEEQLDSLVGEGSYRCFFASPALQGASDGQEAPVGSVSANDIVFVCGANDSQLVTYAKQLGFWKHEQGASSISVVVYGVDATTLDALDEDSYESVIYGHKTSGSALFTGNAEGWSVLPREGKKEEGSW